MSQAKAQIEESWFNVIGDQFSEPYFKDLKLKLLEEKTNFKVYPPGQLIFSAFDHTPFDKVKVVILGQDPYHGFGQANGLCFSVNQGIRLPPSLKNIYKELFDDLNIPISSNGDLGHWAEQGVLLLNSVLTVRDKSAASHKNWGWEIFTDHVIKKLSELRSDLVFLLWGNYAQKKGSHIDRSKHHILTAPHPSPFSVHTGFYGCKHFSKTNSILKSLNKDPINWKIDK